MMLVSKLAQLVWGTKTNMDDLVDRIAARCQAAVWQRVQNRVLSMNSNEARGYIRARAALVLRREMDIALSGIDPVLPTTVKSVAERSMERVVRRTLSEARRMQPQQRRWAA